MSISEINTSTDADPRQIRGKQIAEMAEITRGPKGRWIVPSQSGNDRRYTVSLKFEFCTCPDFETRQLKCKHMWAVEYAEERVSRDGDATVTETVKVTYRQDWSAYNAAQCEEKSRFAALLSDLCADVPQAPQSNGRPRLPMSDMAFASVFKVYTGFSSRRFTSDLRDAQEHGYISRTPHFNSVSNYLADPAMTPVLRSLIATSGLPLRPLESEFAVDSSGFSTSRFVRWYSKKWGKEVDNREWVKLHLMCGTLTHVVTSVEISGWTAHDTNYFKPLLEDTAAGFNVAEVSADKAYLSKSNLTAVEAIGATPFVPFKTRSFARSSATT